MLKGLIFDLDGVVTNTALYHLKAWGALANSIGIKLPIKAQDELRGLSRMDSLNLILSYGHKEDQYSEAEKIQLATQKNQQYLREIDKMTKNDILPGIMDLLKQARNAHLKLAIASASQNAPAILNKLGIMHYFNGIVDPNRIEHGKPNPEIYQVAQKLLNLKADEVVSFEDAKSGVQAIKAAKQFAVGIGNEDILKEADLVVSSTDQLNLDKIIKCYQNT